MFKKTLSTRARAFMIALAVLFALCMSFASTAVVLAESASSDEPIEAIGTAPADAEEASDDAASPEQGDTLTTGTSESTEAAQEEAEQESAKEPIKFVLFKKLKKVDTKGWILFGSAVALAVISAVYLKTRKKEDASASIERKVSPTVILVHGALCVALSFVLSYFKLFSMPNGGSITLASMLPIMIYANRYGVRNGLLAGLVLGILQYIQEGYFVHWLQFIFDYPLAFALIGLAGTTKGIKNLVSSVLIGGTARFLSHFIGGILFWGQYVMIGENAEKGMTFMQMLPANASFSFSYNAPYMFADIAICAIIAMLPPFRKAIREALKY